MPKRPLKPCAYPGCAKLVRPGEKYCEKHRKQKHIEYKERRNDKEVQVIYNTKRWKKVRELALKRDGGLCVMCLKEGRIVKADVVDHIIEIKDGGDPYDLNNLQSLCNKCHAKKTFVAREGRV